MPKPKSLNGSQTEEDMSSSRGSVPDSGQSFVSALLLRYMVRQGAMGMEHAYQLALQHQNYSLPNEAMSYYEPASYPGLCELYGASKMEKGAIYLVYLLIPAQARVLTAAPAGAEHVQPRGRNE